jgi:Tfp pilus assembly protein PilF
MFDVCRPALAVVVWSLAILIATPRFAQSQSLADAEKLRLSGRYEEATEVYSKLPKDQQIATLIGIARCEVAVGEYEQAVAAMAKQESIKGFENADVSAELATLELQCGNYQAAQQAAERALKSDANHLGARWTLAELHRLQGRVDEANKAYEWFVDYYNEHDNIADAESLHIIGLAAAQFARWNRNAEQFKFLVNKLYPSILKIEPNYWPARLEAGLLFLEKYNTREATTELHAALAINPNAAEVHAARAKLALQSFDLERAQSSLDQCLAINPHLPEALQLQADGLMANFRVAEAIDLLEKKSLPQNKLDFATRGRLAAAYGYADGLNRSEEELKRSRMQQLIDETKSLGIETGEFYFAMAEAFDLLRKYPAAAKAYDEALQRMPQLTAVHGQLGMMQMRLGDEAAARKTLEESFKIDPFNVRVKNTLEVLDVLDNYAVLETEHFVIKFDRGRDQMLAEYAAEFLENEVYPNIVKQLDYEPQGKSLFEIFSRAKNTSGHGWFSARMVGLPYIGTVGACAGRMVAMVSPGDTPEPFNWARVLRHEFVHVVNLQQTDFNIPHWFTEALAVRSEGYPRPPDWTALLARRHAEKTLFSLDNVNHGFLRPGAGDDWTLAYCQSEIYAEYMVERFGDDALAKMLSAYADNLSTAAAIERSFGVTQVDFEQGYGDHIAKLVKDVDVAKPQSAESLDKLEAALKKDPTDAEANASLAYLWLQRKTNASARKHALAALKKDRKQQLASYVMARLYLLIGDSASAVKFLEESLQKESPDERHLSLLAALYAKANKPDEARQLYELGQQHFPGGDAWLKRLAGVYLQAKDDAKLAATLEQLTQLDTENLAFRQKLAQLALARKDFAAAEKWSMDSLYINIQDAPLHALRAESLIGLGQHAKAAKEYHYALVLDADKPAWRLAMAEAYLAAGDKASAKAALAALIEKDADYPGAKALLQKVNE